MTDTDRLAWLEESVRHTEEYIRDYEADGGVELAFARPGTEDYDYEIDRKASADFARRTLNALRAERTDMLSRRALRKDDWGQG